MSSPRTIPLLLTVYDDASGYVEDLEAPAFPVFNAVEALSRASKRIHMDVELFRALERFIEAGGFKAVKVAGWIANEKLHTISSVYARKVHETAKAVKFEVIWSVEMMKVKDVSLVNRREYNVYELDCEKVISSVGSREERTLRGVVLTREVWVPKSALQA
jgi:hypothetical protein